MEGLCLSSIPSFHVLVNLLSIANIIMKEQSWQGILLGVLQFIISLIILIVITIRYKYTMRKLNILTLIVIFVTITIIQLSLNLGQENYILNIIQLLSMNLLISLLFMKRDWLAIGILMQIYIIALYIDSLSLYLWFSKQQFSLSRAIAIVGSGGVGLITLYLCMLCQLKPQSQLKKELHIIIGFYIFCEIFICCMIIVECINCSFNEIIVQLALMKLSNIHLDILLYPFAQLQQPQKGQITKISVVEMHTLKTESPSMPNQEKLESECQSQTTIEMNNKNTVIKTSTKWINKLLEIY